MTQTKPAFDAEGPMRVDSVAVEWIPDESPDLSWLGKYTDEADDWNIVRVGEHAGEYVADLPEDADLPERGREYRYFIPYAGGEKPGSKDYKVYGKQDYERMEALQRGDWQSQGCVAKAEVSYPTGNGNRRLETLSSGGLWGIESDSDREFLDEVEREQLDDLADHLNHFGFDVDVESLREKLGQ